MKSESETNTSFPGFSFSRSIIKNYARLFSHFQVKSNPCGKKVCFKKDPNIPAEGFRISLQKEKVLISFSDQRGKLFALQEFLKRISQNNLPLNEIEDHPRLQFRGFSLDISRGAIPKLKTLRQLAFQLFLNRYNHFALYIEDTLQNELLEKYFPEKEVLLLTDLKKLQQFCRKYQLELFPEVQLLGHLEKILSHPALKKYASKSDPSCINVSDPAGCELIDNFVYQNISHFSSQLINIGFDELDNLSSNEIFKRLQTTVTLFKKKRIAIWADQFFKRPELFAALPAGSLLFNWNYFAVKASQFPIFDDQKSRYNQVLCPAVRSWLKFIPDYKKSFQNITAAIQAACKHKLHGVLLTCWGDGGNETLLTAVFPLIDFCAQLAWNPDQPRKKQQTTLKIYPAIKTILNLDQQLPFTHRYYLLEDPLRAPYSRKSGLQQVKANYHRFQKRIKALPSSVESELWQALLNLLLSKVELAVKIHSPLPNKRQIAKAVKKMKKELLNFLLIYSAQWRRIYRPSGLKANKQKFQAILKRLQVLQRILKHKDFSSRLQTEINSLHSAELQLSADWKEIFNR